MAVGREAARCCLVQGGSGDGKRSDRRGLGRLPLQEAGCPSRRRQERRLPHAAVGPDRIGSRYVFLHGFPKSDKANITQDEKKALQFAGKVFLELSAEALSKALQSGVLLEVHCEQDH